MHCVKSQKYAYFREESIEMNLSDLYDKDFFLSRMRQAGMRGIRNLPWSDQIRGSNETPPLRDGNSRGEYDLRDQQHEQGMDHRLVLNFRNELPRFLVFQSPDILKPGSGHRLLPHTSLPAGIWFQMLLPYPSFVFLFRWSPCNVFQIPLSSSDEGGIISSLVLV